RRLARASRRRLLMARAALGDDVEHECRRVRPRDFARGVTVGADRCGRIPLRQLLAMNARLKCARQPDVPLAARYPDAPAGYRRSVILRRQHWMAAVTVRARSGDRQAALRDRLAVNALEILRDVRRAVAAVLADVLAVTIAADLDAVQGIRARASVALRE